MLDEYEKQRVSFLIVNKKFKKAVANYRKKWNIPEDGYSEKELNKKNKEILSSIKVPLQVKCSNDMEKRKKQDRNKILSDFNLSRNCKQFILDYLITNTPPEDIVNLGNLRIFTKKDDCNTNKIRVFIEIYPETSSKDIKNNWIYITQLKRSISGKSILRKKNKDKNIFKRDLRIYELYQKGMSHKKIKEKVEIEMPEKIKRRIYTEDIGHILAKINKKMGFF
jgi:hypothetical protein